MASKVLIPPAHSPCAETPCHGFQVHDHHVYLILYYHWLITWSTDGLSDSPCISTGSNGLSCTCGYVEHGFILDTHHLASNVRVLTPTAPTPSVSQPFTAPASTPWQPPSQPIYPSANAGWVAHFTAAHNGQVPSGPFDNSSQLRHVVVMAVQHLMVSSNYSCIITNICHNSCLLYTMCHECFM